MRAWLYQMSASEWPPERYREEVWEGQPTRWPAGRIAGDDDPAEGDMFFAWYAKARCDDPGLYGWGVVVRGMNEFGQLHWMPVFPSDYLKMHPLFDEELESIVAGIRGPVAQGTMWAITKPQVRELRARIREHV
jgi:hypothetical protein